MATEYKNVVFIGLGTISFNVLTAGVKSVKGKINLPNLIEGSTSNSQVVVTININGGATLYTGLAGAEGFESGGYGSPGDIFNVILSSSLPADQGLNTVKSTISFF